MDVAIVTVRRATVLIRLLAIGVLTAMATVATSARIAVAGDLQRLSVVEFPFEEPVFYYPVDLLCVGDTATVVANRGDGTVVVFDRDWSIVRRFGRLGEGPGELTSPYGLLAWGDTLWVATPQNLVGYGLEGDYVGNRRIPWGMTSLHHRGNLLIGTWTGGSRGQGAAVLMTLTGNVLETFGPRCDASRTADTAGFAVCLGWNILPRASGGYVLVNHFEGDVLIFPDTERDGTKKHLGIGKGKVLSEWSFQSVINDVCADPRGGYWVLTYKLDGQSQVCRFDESWELRGKYGVDRDIGQGAIRILPDGTLCLVEEEASRLHIFQRP